MVRRGSRGRQQVTSGVTVLPAVLGRRGGAARLTTANSMGRAEERLGNAMRNLTIQAGNAAWPRRARNEPAVEVIVPGKNTARNKNRRNRQRNRLKDNRLSMERFGNVTQASPLWNAPLHALGNTENGAAWAVKALHPCTEGGSVMPKAADGAYTDSALLERRDEYSLSTPFDTQVETWTVWVVSTPYLNPGTIGIAAKAGLTDGEMWQIVRRALGSPADGVNSRYPVWAPVTTITENAFFTRMGSDTWPLGNLGQPPLMADKVSTFRRTWCGLTCDLDAPSLKDQGRVVAGQFAAATALMNIDTNTADPENRASYKTEMFQWKEAEIVSGDSLSFQMEAKHGCYMPLRTWTQTYEPTAATESRHVVIAREDNTTVVTNATELGYLLCKGAGWGVIQFAGISSEASIRVKRREGLEFATPRNSPYSPFMTPGSPKDELAMSVVHEFGRTQPHAYPAKFNHSNGILSTIVANLGGVLSNLGIPIVSDLAGIIGGIGGGLLGSIGL